MRKIASWINTDWLKLIDEKMELEWIEKIVKESEKSKMAEGRGQNRAGWSVGTDAFTRINYYKIIYKSV